MSNLTAGKILIPYARVARKKLTKYSGPQGRIDLLRQTITNLVRKERIELFDFIGFEARQYTERLIDLAKKYGDRHIGTMEMADYWLLEKDLVPKLFKVIVPRFDNQMGPYTSVFKLPIEYPGHDRRKIVLELKGNPYPPVVTETRTFDKSLTNILINGLRKDNNFSKS